MLLALNREVPPAAETIQAHSSPEYSESSLIIAPCDVRRRAPAAELVGSNPVLLFAHVFHPVDNLRIELFRNCDMRHASNRRSAVPVLLARREPDDIPRSNLLDRPALP